jgi:hypothetical protein
VRGCALSGFLSYRSKPRSEWQLAQVHVKYVLALFRYGVRRPLRARRAEGGQPSGQRAAAVRCGRTRIVFVFAQGTLIACPGSTSIGTVFFWVISLRILCLRSFVAGCPEAGRVRQFYDRLELENIRCRRIWRSTY